MTDSNSILRKRQEIVSKLTQARLKRACHRHSLPKWSVRNGRISAASRTAVRTFLSIY